MKILKMMLLAAPTMAASVLLLGNQVQAATPEVSLVSAQPTHELPVVNATEESNPILDQLGCKCAQCQKTKFELLQGKLPSAINN